MRKRRNKSPNYKYHIRVRGLDEVALFQDGEDKQKYIEIIKKYKRIHKCKVYSMCLMNTHGHIFIDPRGYDISKFMHKVNLCYSQYYNKKYNRGGPVFRGRFESDPVCTNTYCLALSAYIHNNPKDVHGYRGREEYFYFSSYGIYAGLRENDDNVIDIEFILSLMMVKTIEKARIKYIDFVKKQSHHSSIQNIIECLASGELFISDETLFEQ